MEKQPTSAENAPELTALDQMRVTQVLHDELREYFATLSFHARMLADDLSEEHSAHHPQAEQMIVLIRRTNDVMRRLNRIMRAQGAAAVD